jgi:hypothetical protein
MKEYSCNLCGKFFNQKCHWVNHTQNKKYPCVKKTNLINTINGSMHGSTYGSNIINCSNNLDNLLENSDQNINKKESSNSNNISINNVLLDGANNEDNLISGAKTIELNKMDKITNKKIDKKIDKKMVFCKFCLREFLYTKNLNKHIREERCEVLRIQKQQKENIFINLLEEEKIVNQTKKDIKYNTSNESITEKPKESTNQIDFLINQIKILNEKLDEQKDKFEKELERQKMETYEKMKNEIEIERKKIETEARLKIMTERYSELEQNNSYLKKTNEKLQNKVNKIVNKNKINNTQNITNNTIINNNGVKLVNFGSEDLEKIPHSVFIDTVRSQGAGLYNKAIEGIYFNKDYPENQNIYISDINRGKVMIYKDEKWFLDNWDNIYPILLDKIIQFGYDRNDFLKDCGYKIGDDKYNKQMIKNGMRWYKLLDADEPDVEYFETDPEDRPEIDKETYNDYLEMYNFRKKHPRKTTELNIKNKLKLNMYNKRNIPIENFKHIEDSNKKLLTIE